MAGLTAEREQQVQELLAELVAIPSVNVDPAESDLSRPEAAMLARVAGLLDELGMETTRHEVRCGRENLLGQWPADGTPVTLEAHVDTVGVDEMTIAPFAAEVREGRMWGRGCCDTKGSLACFVSALRFAREDGWVFDRPVQLAAVMGEETGCEGALALAASDVDLGWVVVGEPTGGEVVTAHKSCAWLTITTHGRSTHASVPEAGENAIYLMRRVVAYLEEVWLPGLAAFDHPLLGRPTGSVGMIRGGEKVNVVPARCRIDLDHRYLPGMDVAATLHRLEDGLRRYLGEAGHGVEVVAAAGPFPGFDLPPDSPFAQRMIEAARQSGASGEARGVSYFSDAGPYHERGFPAVVFGPGDIRQAHGPAEYVELAELSRATATIMRLLEGFRLR